MTSLVEREPGSFRDPCGFIFLRQGELFRQVNATYQADFRALLDSGLYDELVTAGLLVAHEEVDLALRASDQAVAVLRPERLTAISYPYEWCFGQLKDAALCTLEIQRRALNRGMSLKDASAFNIQFAGGRPVLIDTLSFEAYEEGKPWIAYRQFCGHFLAPLALMALVDVRLSRLMQSYLDGIPLDLAALLLPWKTKLKPGLAMHLHLHAKAQSKSQSPQSAASPRGSEISKTGLLGLIDSLESTVRSLNWQPEGTTWAEYYDETNYTDEAFAKKAEIVEAFIDRIEPQPQTCWDLGANTGEFSRLAAKKGIDTLAFDFDPAAVEKAYRSVKAKKTERLLPLWQDLTNPTPALGWAGAERASLSARGPAELLLTLALVHHLAIGNNVPLPSVAEFFASVGEWLIVEFVDKPDSQVQKMLSSRRDVFPDYHRDGFEHAFAGSFDVIAREEIPGMQRTLYLMRRR